MSDTVWFNDPSILINLNHIYEIIPNSSMNLIDNINALARLIILITIISFLFLNNFTILISGLVTLGLIYLIYNNKLKEKEEFCNFNMTNEITYKNPLNNNLPGDSPDKKEAPLAYIEDNEEKINNAVKEMIQQENSTFGNINEKLFKDLGEKIEFDRSMIPFNSNPDTKIPNDQNSFANYCYGSMLSAKEGDQFKLMSRTNQLYNLPL